MKYYLFSFASLFVCLIFQGCLAKKELAQYQISDGVYISKILSGNREKVYIDNEDQFLSVIPLQKYESYYEPDTSNRTYLIYPQENSQSPLENALFQTMGLDIDLISIPFKYRPVTAHLPPQLNTNLNALLYAGFRSDFYSIGYEANEIGEWKRYTRHYGVTLGLFSGIGGTAISPFVTNDIVQIEYDGIVWSSGIAASFGFNNLTLGLAYGFDQLLDGNSSVWIYQRKPWLGLVLGINLN